MELYLKLNADKLKPFTIKLIKRDVKNPGGADAKIAVQELLEMLKSGDGFGQQRRANIRHMLLHHDWRFRIRQLCEIFALEVPPSLTEDLDRVRSLADTFE